MRIAFAELDWTLEAQTIRNDTPYPMIVWDAFRHIALIESGKSARFVRHGCNWIEKPRFMDSADLDRMAA